jgi:hypothetical protein
VEFLHNVIWKWKWVCEKSYNAICTVLLRALVKRKEWCESKKYFNTNSSPVSTNLPCFLYVKHETWKLNVGKTLYKIRLPLALNLHENYVFLSNRFKAFQLSIHFQILHTFNNASAPSWMPLYEFATGLAHIIWKRYHLFISLGCWKITCTTGANI